MKILFITFNDINNCTYGGGQCSARNFAAFSANNETEIVRISKRSNFKSFLSLIQGNFPPLMNSDTQKVIGIVKKFLPEIVFIDGSSLGMLSKKIKKEFPNIKIMTFFHNVELDYIDVRIRNRLKKRLYKRRVFNAERMSILKSDRLICLNKRDSERLNDIYGKRADAIIPISFEDICKSEAPDMADPYQKYPAGIMVGSLKADTFEGIKWFCDNVAPFIHAMFYIIGKGFENVKHELERENVVVIGTVDDLSAYYYYADFVCLPILSGAGMKVKTAEALMYGKYVFGTSEAFEGYELDYGCAGGLCNSKDEFINKINGFLGKPHESNNMYNKSIFQKKYSNKTANELFNNEIDTLLKRG